MPVLVTGATGFLGINLLEVLLGRGEEVFATATVPLPEPAEKALTALPGKLTSLTLDARDGAGLLALLRRHGIKRLIHGAAITPGLERERRDPGSTLEINVLGTVRALEAARDADVERVVCMSSGSVYGAAGDDHALLAEDMAIPRPLSVYGISKLAAESTAGRLAQLWDLSVARVRLGTLFGRWEWATGVRDVMSPLTQATALARDGKPISFRDGYELDWLYPTDAAEGIVALLDAPRLGYGVYNLGNPVTWSIPDWCDALSAKFPGLVVDHDPETANPTVTPLAARRPPLDTARMAADIGWRARFGLAESIADLNDWMDENPDFLRWPVV